MNDLIRYINNEVLRQSKNLRYTIKEIAPSTIQDLRNESSLVIWSGASDATIYQDASVNYAFRAIHDALHLKTGLDFSPKHEIEMGRIQASKQSSSLMSELFYTEIARQAEYYLINGVFVQDQVNFTKQYIKGL